MKQFCTLSLAACFAVLLLFQGSTQGQEKCVGPYKLSFAGPAELEGPQNSEKVVVYTCMLSQTGGTVAPQGWSLSMVADGATIENITTHGTAAGPDEPPFGPDANNPGMQFGGFDATNVTTLSEPGTACAGKKGATSAIVLSFTKKPAVTLPLNSVSEVAKLTVRATIPEGGGTATLAYANGCIAEEGSPAVQNVVTEVGGSCFPELGTKQITLILPPPSCDPLVNPDDPKTRTNYGFTAERVKGADTASDPLGSVGGVDGAGAEVVVLTLEGSKPAPAAVYADIVCSIPTTADGVQGWSISLALEGEPKLTAATTVGTDAGAFPDGLWIGGFDATQVVDPLFEPTPGSPQGQGAVSAIVLSFTKKPAMILPKQGASSVLLLEVSPPASDWVQGAADMVGTLKFKDGLVGTGVDPDTGEPVVGQPVQNVITVKGGSLKACNTATASCNVIFRKSAVPPVRNFIRGNANNDGGVDIADPIWIINELFRQGPESPCQDAADANDDDKVDSTDAVYLIEYQFVAGPSPPTPFPQCGTDPDGPGNVPGCEAQQTVCNP